MVKVPTYQGGGQQLRAINQTPVRVNASADSFGGGLGRGLGAVGEGLGQAASAMSAMQELEDTTRAKEADNAYAGWVRESMYGEGGFLTQSGRNAVDGRAAFEAQAAEKRAEFGANLTPGAARAYETASTTNSAGAEFVDHSHGTAAQGVGRRGQHGAAGYVRRGCDRGVCGPGQGGAVDRRGAGRTAGR